MADLKPLFPFAGGKTQYIKYFSQYLQPCETYVEPFIGGGAVFCYVVNHERATKFIINDENRELMRLYADIKSNPKYIAEEAADVAKRYRDNPDGELEYAYLAELAAYKKTQTSGRLLFLLKTFFVMNDYVNSLCVAKKKTKKKYYFLLHRTLEIHDLKSTNFFPLLLEIKNFN